MKTSVLINNYNYGRFVGEAIESVRQQSSQPDELIVVDDGSTDDSLEIIERHLSDFPCGRLISRENGGQLAAFNSGFNASTGDVIFFLDSDDCYEYEHIEKVLSIFMENTDVGFVFTSYRRTDDPEQTFVYNQGEGDLGPSAILTLLSRAYIGSVTSATAVRRSVAELFLPLPKELEHDWITRADDCLVFGASLTGTRKYFLPMPTIRYRVHGNNHFANKHQGDYLLYAHSLRIERLMRFLNRPVLHPLKLRGLLLNEFNLIPNPTEGHLRDYIKAAKNLQLPVRKRLSLRLALRRSYRASRSAK